MDKNPNHEKNGVKSKPLLSVVGAGPGDPDLITLKGVKALQNADVILYDALANSVLLDYASPEAIKIFVGKRKGYKAYKQEEINEMIVEYAEHCGKVVRLKGGDPFLFGRGMEEIVYAEAHGIATEYIPGVTSAIGVPGVNGIPVTHRGASESLWVITATTETGEVSKDIASAAKTNATIVILMGMAKLNTIVELFLQQNRAETPVAIIQSGSMPHQKMVVGKIADISEKAKQADMDSPAVIIIGEVVNIKQFVNSEITEHVK